MPMSASERVKRWQTKTRLKAFYFDDNEDRRRALLTQQFDAAEGDQERLAAIADLFYGLPRCFLAPRWVRPHLDGTGVHFPHGATQWEEAIACMALERYDPNDKVYAVHDWGQMSPHRWLYPEIKGEIDHLISLGMYDQGAVINKRPGAK